jgi:hypothetical protein
MAALGWEARRPLANPKGAALGWEADGCAVLDDFPLP